MRQRAWLSLILLFVFSAHSYADSAFTERKEVQQFINQMAKEHHFNKTELNFIMNQVVLQPKIIESMEKPYEKKNWDAYKSLFLTPQRLKGGIDFWAKNQHALEYAQKRYGVPPEIIVAILGVETLYGEKQGDYRVLDALSTLAFNYPKRAPFFKKELVEYLLLCRDHKVPATYYKGSYAGAIGQPQFMPSSYRYYAIDFDHKGHKDLVTNNADAIASVANYFHKHGWKMNSGIAQTAQWSGWHFKRVKTNPRTANYTYAQLRSAGVKPITAAQNPPARAGLIELMTDEGKEYWLAYPNFFVITRYNSSPQYALVVYLLSQQLKQQWLASNITKHRAYV